MLVMFRRGGRLALGLPELRGRRVVGGTCRLSEFRRLSRTQFNSSGMKRVSPDTEDKARTFLKSSAV